MLLPTKTETEAVAALLVEGAETPEELAKAVIRRLTELREEREVYVQVLQWSPGVYSGFGPFPTRAAALKALPKNPVAQLAKLGAVVSMIGPSSFEQMRALAEEPPTSRGDFAVVRDDARAVKNGWRGKAAERQAYL